MLALQALAGRIEKAWLRQKRQRDREIEAEAEAETEARARFQCVYKQPCMWLWLGPKETEYCVYYQPCLCTDPLATEPSASSS